MKITAQIAKHLREVFFGGNWTASNLQHHLDDVSIEEAAAQVADLNTILALTYHISYYVIAILEVLKGNHLHAKDALSYQHPEISNEAEWMPFRQSVFENASALALMIERLDDNILNTSFTDEKYGNYFRNFTGLIEHCHYHLGQIVLIKKIIWAGL